MRTAFLKGLAGLFIGFCLLTLRNSPLSVQDYGLFVIAGIVTGICIPFLVARFFQNYKILGFSTILAPFTLGLFFYENYALVPLDTFPILIGILSAYLLERAENKVRYILIAGLIIIGLSSYQFLVPYWHWSQPDRTQRLNNPIFVHSLETLNKENVTRQALDKKVVFMEFWGFNCGFCLERMPKHIELEAKFRNNPNVIITSVNINSDSTDRIKAYFAEKKYDMNVLTDYKGQFFKTLQIQGVPSAILIDKKGNLRRIYSGWSKDLDRGMLWYVGNDIEKLLNEP
jgi:thiol-disulfide isomerase/thioredoxin